ncbi:MAG: 1-aminocyclopropane-1-carboxylate deaminase [Campylobacterota bacterium]
MSFINSPIQKVVYNNKSLYIKRDDLLHEDFSGNKARKFYYFLKNEFLDIKKIVSHGSCQSNAMYSLSVLAKLRGWKFDYYVNHIPSYLQDNPIGNYKQALKNGMNIKIDNIPLHFKKSELFINEGGALKQAQYGIEILANEIIAWANQNKIENLKVFLPSGTGTTALFLQKFLPFEVLTCSCVGDDDYLKKQFEQLEATNHPNILKKQKKYHFGKLYKDLYETYNDLYSQTNIEFDLLYDSVGFMTLKSYLDELLETSEVLYIHQGGLKGNISMLQRYKHKYDKT